MKCKDCPYTENGCGTLPCEEAEKRADFAASAVARYRKVVRSASEYEAFLDLLADLGHLYDRLNRRGKVPSPHNNLTYFDLFEEVAHVYYADEKEEW